MTELLESIRSYLGQGLLAPEVVADLSAGDPLTGRLGSRCFHGQIGRRRYDGRCGIGFNDRNGCDGRNCLYQTKSRGEIESRIKSRSAGVVHIKGG